MDATIDKAAGAGASRDPGHGISFAEADAVAGTRFRRLLCHGVHYGFALLVGQLCVSPVASRHQR